MKRGDRLRRVIATVGLGGLGFLINLLPLPLYPSLDFLLGSVLVMVAATAGGPWLGALAGFIASLPTVIHWHEWFGVLQFTLEGLVVGALATRMMLLFAAPLYWLTLGVPLLLLHVATFVYVPPPGVLTWTIIGTIAVKLIMNSLVNAAIAEGVLLHPRARRWIRLQFPEARLPTLTIPRFMVVIMVMMAGLPTLFLTAQETRRSWHNEIRQAWTESLFASRSAALALQNAFQSGLLSPPLSTEELIAIRGVLSQNKSPHVRSLSVIDAEGRVVAVSGPEPSPRILRDFPFPSRSGTASLIPEVGESPAFLRDIGLFHVGFTTMDGPQWQIVAEVDNGALLSGIIFRIVQSLFLLVMIWAIAFLLGCMLSPVMTRPWTRLSASLDRMTSGDLHARALPEDLSEAHAIGKSFNRMSQELETTISELKETNRKLELANDELRSFDKVKGTFLNAVSHDLRIPLTSILGFAEFLQEGLGGQLNPQQLSFVNQIIESTRYMTRLLNELLDFARMEAGRLRISPDSLDYAELVNRTAETFRHEAERKGVTLQTDVPLSVPLVADPDRLTRVLNNLLSNAIKFTPPGGSITIWVRPTPDGIRTEVRDTGIGIPLKDQAQLFEKFFQTEAGKAAGGSGLGLSIAKAIVEAHGGVIGASSTPGKGSTFWFVLPPSPPPTAAGISAAPDAQAT